jgi:hypothetical protein
MTETTQRTLSILRVTAMAACCLPAATAWAGPPDANRALSLSPRGEVSRFALVIGNNTTLDSKQTALRFADDDAARMAELLAESGADVELVTAFDKESQESFSNLVPGATRPTKKGFEKAWKRLRERMDEAERKGTVEFVVYYSGHGDVGPDGRGFLTLDGGKLTRNDLFGKLLKESPADHNHLIIDACRSEEFVLSRGKEWKPDKSRRDYADAVSDYLDKQHLGSFPNTGVILASSADQQTHEWERYRGGIFTHELLSGLRGGADLNGDGRVEYSELGAFVSAANSGVSDPRARLQVTVRPPQMDQRSPVIVHQDVAKQRVLLFASSDENRYTVEDLRGVRLADVRRSGERPGYLRLPPGDVFIYREPEKGERMDEAAIGADSGGIVLASTLKFHKSTRTARGSLDEAFREGLFAVAYGPSYYAGYTASENVLAVAEPEWEVEVWEEDEHGNQKKIATVDSDDVNEGPDSDSKKVAVVVKEESEEDWDWGDTWGSLSFGGKFLTFAPEGTVTHPEPRISGNQFNGFTSSGFGRHFRGFDARWYIFDADSYKDYPRADAYMRMGFEQGSMDFEPRDEESGFEVGDAMHFRYRNVPVFFGFNVYIIRRFPIRPYAGASVGLDIARLDYTRFTTIDDAPTHFEDLVARPGFEVHAGLDVRITNFVSLVWEVGQLWSARKKYTGVPDFSNTGMTAMAGLRVGFPLGPKARHKRRVSKTVVEVTESTVTETSKSDPKPAVKRVDAGNCAQGHCEVTCGENCASECIGGDCEQVCEAGADCSFKCLGGDCEQTCKAGSKCELSCLGEDCTRSCADGACLSR